MARRGGRQALFVGLPMIGGVIVGSLFLKQFMSGKYEVLDMQGGPMSKKELDEINRMNAEASKVTFDLDEELQKINQHIDLSQWETKRVPRPDEE
mmetsp:Transcript_15489/g.60570  ORF Transcript_15489/g.60570 Transcript_15489/m.60570 type:complete len:95 (+) Transcript_15489:28-312(+)